MAASTKHEVIETITQKEYFERIIEEQQKALRLAAIPVDTKLDYLTVRVDKIEKTQARAVGMALVGGALTGGIIGHFWK